MTIEDLIEFYQNKVNLLNDEIDHIAKYDFTQSLESRLTVEMHTYQKVIEDLKRIND